MCKFYRKLQQLTYRTNSSPCDLSDKIFREVDVNKYGREKGVTCSNSVLKFRDKRTSPKTSDNWEGEGGGREEGGKTVLEDC